MQTWKGGPPRASLGRRRRQQAHPLRRTGGFRLAHGIGGLLLGALAIATLTVATGLAPHASVLGTVGGVDAAALAAARTTPATLEPSPLEPASTLLPALAALATPAPTATPAASPTATPAASAAPSPAHSATPPSASTATPAVAGTLHRAIRSVVFLGDSYTSGWAGAGYGSRGWPAQLAAAYHWRATNLAVPGTGYVNPGWTSQPVGTRVAAAIRTRADLVILATGHNDSRWSAAAINRAADQVINRLRAGLPHAVIVIVAPIWPDGHPPLRALLLRNHLRAKAAAIGALFIDPLAGGWFAGANHVYIGRDGIHPTNAGHRHLAAIMIRRLSGIAAR